MRHGIQEYFDWTAVFLPPASAVKVMFSVPSVHLSVNTLTAEPFDIRTGNLVEGFIWKVSRTSLILKVIGQRSPSQKTWFSRHIKGENECSVYLFTLLWHIMSYSPLYLLIPNPCILIGSQVWYMRPCTTPLGHEVWWTPHLHAHTRFASQARGACS